VFKADKTVTVIRCTTDGDTDLTRYTCRTFAGCSWYADHAARAERNGTAPAPTVKVRIPAASIQAADPGWTPQPNDLLVLGEGLAIEGLFARGRTALWQGKTLMKGKFE